MDARIAVEKLPYYVAPSDEPKRYELIPLRHVCGRILWANMDGESQMYYRDPYGETPRIYDCPHCKNPLDPDWIRPLGKISPIPYWMAVLTIARRVCSNCWGRLDMSSRDIPVLNDDGMLEAHRYVICPRCRFETVGYVTHRWVDECRRTDDQDFETVHIGLMQALEMDIPEPEPVVKKTRNELLSQLGF